MCALVAKTVETHSLKMTTGTRILEVNVYKQPKNLTNITHWTIQQLNKVMQFIKLEVFPQIWPLVYIWMFALRTELLPSQPDQSWDLA